jgi:hypothetical protein
MRDKWLQASVLGGADGSVITVSIRWPSLMVPWCIALTTVIDDKLYWLGVDGQIAETLSGYKQYEIILCCWISQIETQATSPWKEMLSDKVSSDLDDFFIWLSINTGDWKACLLLKIFLF